MTNEDSVSHDKFFGFWIEVADGLEGGHDGLFMILSDCPVIM